MKVLIDWILEIEPGLNKSLEIRDKLDNVDAVICTGSDNTARYFEYYFGKHPHIIRKNRTSVAILDGSESDSEMTALSDDIFSYYGLGCRNVSKIYIPGDYDFKALFKNW